MTVFGGDARLKGRMYTTCIRSVCPEESKLGICSMTSFDLLLVRSRLGHVCGG